MAVRKKIRHDEETRAKIQAAQLINRLHQCAMGEIDLTPAQVSAGKALLDKVLPNLQAVDMSVESDDTQWVVADRPMSRQEYEKTFAQGTVESAAGAANTPHQLPN